MPCAWVHTYSGSAAAGFHPGQETYHSAPHSNFILVLQFLCLPEVHWQEWSLFLMASPQHIGFSLLWLVKSVITTPYIPSLYNFVDLLFTVTSFPIPSLFFNKVYFLKRFYLFILERGREGERRRETSMCGCLSCTPCWGLGLQPKACALIGNPTSDPLACRLVLNPLNHSGPGLIVNFCLYYFM